MWRRALVLPVLAAAAGCGGSKPEPRPVDPTPAPLPTERVAVARTWAQAVRADDIKRASALFALPATIENGPPPVRVRSRLEVDAFNSSLPCGAVLLRARKVGRDRVLATYTLTERPGAPEPCGSGTGARAGVLFTIRGGRIVEWLRARPETGPARTPRPKV